MSRFGKIVLGILSVVVAPLATITLMPTSAQAATYEISWVDKSCTVGGDTLSLHARGTEEVNNNAGKFRPEEMTISGQPNDGFEYMPVAVGEDGSKTWGPTSFEGTTTTAGLVKWDVSSPLLPMGSWNGSAKTKLQIVKFDGFNETVVCSWGLYKGALYEPPPFPRPINAVDTHFYVVAFTSK